MSITEPNLYWIKFGRDGLEVRAPKKGKRDVGTLPQNMESVEYAESKDVYNKDELYTRTEMKKLIEDLLVLLDIDDEDKNNFFNTYFNSVEQNLSLKETTQSTPSVVAKDLTVNTDISLNNYEVLLDKTVEVTVKLTDSKYSPVRNKEIVLTCDKGYFENVPTINRRKKTLTTGNDGVASATFTASEYGLVTFTCNGVMSQCNVLNPTTKKTTTITLISNENNVVTFKLTNFIERQINNIIIDTTDTTITTIFDTDTLTIEGLTNGKITIPSDYTTSTYYTGATYTLS